MQCDVEQNLSRNLKTPLTHLFLLKQYWFLNGGSGFLRLLLQCCHSLQFQRQFCDLLTSSKNRRCKRAHRRGIFSGAEQRLLLQPQPITVRRLIAARIESFRLRRVLERGALINLHVWRDYTRRLSLALAPFAVVAQVRCPPNIRLLRKA